MCISLRIARPLIYQTILSDFHNCLLISKKLYERVCSGCFTFSTLSEQKRSAALTESTSLKVTTRSFTQHPCKRCFFLSFFLYFLPLLCFWFWLSLLKAELAALQWTLADVVSVTSSLVSFHQTPACLEYRSVNYVSCFSAVCFKTKWGHSLCIMVKLSQSAPLNSPPPLHPTVLKPLHSAMHLPAVTQLSPTLLAFSAASAMFSTP